MRREARALEDQLRRENVSARPNRRQAVLRGGRPSTLRYALHRLPLTSPFLDIALNNGYGEDRVSSHPSEFEAIARTSRL